MLLIHARVFVRRCRRLVLALGIVLSETLHVNLTVRHRPRDKRLRYRAERQAVACRRVLKVWGIDVKLQGPTGPRQAALIASNHLGIADVFLISSVYPVATSGKIELMRVPIVGWVCRSIGMIPVDRSRRLLTADFAKQVSERLDAGVDVLVFPEGTTGPGIELLPFKTGGFAAIERGAARIALPMALIVSHVDGRAADARTQAWFTWTDSRQSLFSHLWRLLGIQSARIEIRVGTPVEAEGRDRKELADVCFSEVSRMCKSQQLAADTTG